MKPYVMSAIPSRSKVPFLKIFSFQSCWNCSSVAVQESDVVSSSHPTTSVEVARVSGAEGLVSWTIATQILAPIASLMLDLWEDEEKY